MVRIVASEHPIKSVTIFKSAKAEVVRVFTLDLQKGQNKIEITRLSSVIDINSVRVSGLKPNCRLFDVVCRVGKAQGHDDGTLRTLKSRRDQLIKERDTREKGTHLLFEYAQTITGEHVGPDQMTQFVDKLVEQDKKTQAAIAHINEQLVSINRSISNLEDADSSQLGSTNGKVEIVVVADDDCTSELKITYLVSKVEWYPSYELHAKTDNGKPSPSVSLHYRARITQSTGESWNNTSLVLSTVSSDSVFDAMIPQLKALKIQPAPLFGSKARMNNVNNNNAFTAHSLFGSSKPQAAQTFGIQPQQQQQQQQQQQAPQASLFGSAPAAGGSGLFGSTPSSGFGAFGTTHTRDSQPSQQAQPFQTTSLFGVGSQPGAPPPVVPLPDEDFEQVEYQNSNTLTEAKTIVSETPIAISYSVHGESTIPSDGFQHQVSIAILPFQGKVSYITIPRINPRVFLQCTVVNSSEYRLLAGPVSVIMDESYVSKTSIPDINTGDTFECTLGDDSSTKVNYSRTSRLLTSTGGSFAEVTTTTSYTTTITVHNKHNFPITDLIVRDVIPTCDDKRVKIVLRKPAGLADAKDGQTVDVAGTDGLKVGWEKLVDGKGGEKEGRYEYKFKVGSGAKAVFVSEWEVKAPGDTHWYEVFNPELRFGQKA